MEKLNILYYCYPSLYEIYCHETHRSYFGHSKNVVYRLGRHFNDLEKQNHEIRQLQDDWIHYGRKAFCFRPLEYGEQ